MIGKLKSMVTRVRDDVINFIPLKGAMLTINGAGASNPTIIDSYNVTSVVRTGIGVYRVTLTKSTFFGIDIINKSVSGLAFSITSNTNTDANFVALSPVGGGIFDIVVTEMVQGTGNRLDFNPYDIRAADRIDASLLVNAGTGRLPPE